MYPPQEVPSVVKLLPSAQMESVVDKIVFVDDQELAVLCTHDCCTAPRVLYQRYLLQWQAQNISYLD